MGTPFGRKGDVGSGHGSFPSTTIMLGSSNVIVESKEAARKGDPLFPHGSPSPSPVHSRTLCGGSKKVITNSKQTIKIGDPVCCGGLVVTGAGKVIVGG